MHTLTVIVLAAGTGDKSTLHDVGVALKDYLPVFISFGALTLAYLSYRKSVSAEERVKDAQGEIRMEWGWETYPARPPEVSLQVEVFNTSPVVPLHIRKIALLAVTAEVDEQWHAYEEELFSGEGGMETVAVGAAPFLASVNPAVTKKLPWLDPDVPIYAWVRTGNNTEITALVRRDFQPMVDAAASWAEWPPVGDPDYFMTAVNLTNPLAARTSKWKFWKWHPIRKLRMSLAD